jgi:spermidine synthase
LLNLGEIDAAMARFNKAIRVNPNYLDAHFDLGRALMRKEQYQDAIVQFREVTRLQRGHFGGLYNLGTCLMKLNRPGDAIKEYIQALRTNPQDFALRMAIGRALVQLGNYREAVPHFFEAIRQQSDNPDAHYDLALALLQLGRFDEAVAHNEEAIHLRPDWPEALNNLAWILATNPEMKDRKPDRAVELAERARKLADYKMPQVLDTQAAAFAAAGKFTEAIKTAERAVTIAKETGQDAVAKDIGSRLELYRANKPYLAAAPAKPPTEK